MTLKYEYKNIVDWMILKVQASMIWLLITSSDNVKQGTSKCQ